jgi:hypothetical protein
MAAAVEADAFRADQTELSLTEKQLLVLPRSLFTLKSLSELDLSHNFLTSLPAEIGFLSNLCVFFVGPVNRVSVAQGLRVSWFPLVVHIKRTH